MRHRIPRPDGIRGVCRHYRGLKPDDSAHKCAAGVLMTSVRHEHDPPIEYELENAPMGHHPYRTSWSLPCIQPLSFGCPPCPRAVYSTEEEVAAWRTEIDDLMRRTKIARDAILANVQESGEAQGRIPCPLCKTGDLRFRITEALNGKHLHAACSTPDCVSWME